jgi:hypothetical protein
MSREDVVKVERSVFKKVKDDLCNKYRHIVYDKEFNVNAFDKRLMNIVKEYNYVNRCCYNELFVKCEKAFLKALAKKEDAKRRNGLEKEDVRRIIMQEEFYFYEGNNNNKEGKNKTKRDISRKAKGNGVDKEVRRLNQERCEMDVEKKIQKKKEMNCGNKTPIAVCQVKELMKQI